MEREKDVDKPLVVNGIIYSPHFKIDGPYGRLGNNMFQLINCLFLVDIFNSTVDISKLKNNLDWFVDITSLMKDINDLKFINRRLTISHDYFYLNKVGKKINQWSPFKLRGDLNYWVNFRIGNNVINQRELCRKYILNNLREEFHNVPVMSERVCCIHIRSGDIFKRRFASSMPKDYVQPPLAFYLKIIQDYWDEYDKFLVVTEMDRTNPCIGRLRMIGDKVEVQSKSLKEDIKTMLSAQTLVIGTSTLPICLAQISTNLKRIFICDRLAHNYQNRGNFDKEIEIILCRFKRQYIPKQTWVCSLEQVMKMINYKMNDLVFVNI
jgi:hypothetical protein